jgi:hypothetical protein
MDQQRMRHVDQELLPPNTVILEDNNRGTVPAHYFNMEIYFGKNGQEHAREEGCSSAVDGYYNFSIELNLLPTVKMLRQSGCIPAQNYEFFAREARRPTVDISGTAVINAASLKASYDLAREPHVNLLSTAPSWDVHVWGFCGNIDCVMGMDSESSPPGNASRAKLSWDFGSPKNCRDELCETARKRITEYENMLHAYENEELAELAVRENWPLERYQ